ncbi:MAG: hypothetical protein ACTSPQ_15575 [Candidatus Helarchaeota archaeon]
MVIKALKIADIKKPLINYPLDLFMKILAWLMLFNSSVITKQQPVMTPAAIKVTQQGLRADCSKAFKELGLPKRPIKESIRDALIWFAENGYIKDKKAVKNLLELKKEVS